MSHDPSEIILICWFGAKETIKGAFTLGSIAWSKPSSIAPPSVYLRLRDQASSCLPCCLVKTVQEKAAKRITLLSSLLYLWVWTIGFISKASVHNSTYVCLVNVLQMLWRTLKVNRNEIYSFLLVARQSCLSGKWVKCTNTHLYQIIRL